MGGSLSVVAPLPEIVYPAPTTIGRLIKGLPIQITRLRPGTTVQVDIARGTPNFGFYDLFGRVTARADGDGVARFRTRITRPERLKARGTANFRIHLSTEAGRTFILTRPIKLRR